MKKALFSIVYILFVFLTIQKVSAYELVGPGGEGSGYTLDDVAYTVSLVSCTNNSSISSSLNTSGHSFILIENETSLNFTLVNNELGPYDAMSLGTYGNTSPKGLWINRELYLLGGKELSNGVSVMSRTITFREKDNMEEDLLFYIGWEYTKNCSYYAVNVWNNLFSDDLSASQSFGIPTPTGLYNDMIGESICYSSIYLPKEDSCFNY